MRLIFFLILGLVGVAQAETIQDLTRNNASPDEIIQKLNAPVSQKIAVQETKEPIEVGTVVSLIHQGEDTPFYDFTIALTDGRVVTVSDANHLALKPGDVVILKGQDSFWQIKDKMSR